MASTLPARSGGCAGGCIDVSVEGHTLRFVCALVAGLVALSVYPAWAEEKPDGAAEAAEAITVEARPIASFDRIEAGKTHFGKLKWRGGLVLTSTSSQFGGWSSPSSMLRARHSPPSRMSGVG